MLSDSRSLSEYFAWQRSRSRPPALVGRAALWRTATLAGCMFAVVVAAVVLVHEIGHHFGMNERDLEELGYG